MSERRNSTDAEISDRLHSLWTSELARAETDYHTLPERPATHGQLVSAGAIATAIAAVAMVLIVRQIDLPSPSSSGIQLGGDGLPREVGGESVLRGDEIAQRLADNPAAPFLAGGRLVVHETGCSNDPSAESCLESWKLAAVDGSGPAFDLDNVAEATGFVRTSGALTVFRVEPVARPTCANIACPDELSTSAVVWRAPTKGSVPSNASSNTGAIYDALWPDFVATYASDGERLAGYIAKTDLLGGHEGPFAVYGEDLNTVVGYRIAGQGFVPIAEYSAPPAPTSLPVGASPLEILTSYLQAVEARDCAAAMIAVGPRDIVPTTNALCASSTRVTAYEIDSRPLRSTNDTRVFSVTLTTDGPSFGLPAGPNAWSFTLSQQAGESWLVTGGGPA